MGRRLIHLDNAARTLSAILNRPGAEHSFAVSVREGDRHDARGLTAAALWQNDVGAEAEHPAALDDGNPSAPADGTDHDSGEQAA